MRVMIIRALFVFLLVAAGLAGFKTWQVYEKYKLISDLPHVATIGAEDADIKVLEFFDYSCPYCRDSYKTLRKAAQKDGGVSYIPMPIISDNQKALDKARIMVAASYQGKADEMHNAFMTMDGEFNKESLAKIAHDNGVDLHVLLNDIRLNHNEIQEDMVSISQVHKMLDEKGSVPMFIINDKYIYTPKHQNPTVQDFLDMFAVARGNKI